MAEATPDPTGRRRLGPRALAWAIAAGALLAAPEAAAAGEVAPPDDATVGEPREAGEVAPLDDATVGEPREAGEVAPLDDATVVRDAGEVAASAEVRAPEAPALREPTVSPVEPPRGGRLSQYLQRPVRFGAHFVDHGVLQAAVAGGWPHGYRVELSLGLLDHVTLGATTHWLPGQPRPRVSPLVAIAILRGRLFEVGAWHFWSLFPPPRDDVDPATPSYQRTAQWFLATASFGQAWLTGGLDAGAVRARVNDPGQDPAPDTSNPSAIRWRFGGGLHLRAGTRRWGFTAQVLVPHLTAELRFDLRFGLFEQRSRGGWRVYGKAEDWDRGVPW